MNKFLQLPADKRKTIYEQVSLRLGIDDAKAIEKDLWMSGMLQCVFLLPYADKLVFKGGSSLSKVWNLISRFSEDIDLAIDRSIFDMDGDLTKKQLKKLRKTSSLFVKEKFSADLWSIIESQGLAEYCQLIVDPDKEGDDTYPEPRKVHIAYRSVFDTTPSDYLQSEVLLEVGARSLFEPTIKAKVNSLVGKNLPITTTVEDVDIITAVPQKTFLEKAFLLHELFTTDRCAVADKKSRHLYDLERMMDEQFAIEAIHDDQLWETIHHHREVFTSIKDDDYTPDIRRRIVLLPPPAVIDVWREDYKAMQISMIYGEELPFEKLIERIALLQERFRSI